MWRFQIKAPHSKRLLLAAPQLILHSLSTYHVRGSLHRRSNVTDLARLNGYEPISIPLHHVPLAEGVMAVASKTLQKDYSVYGKPSSSVVKHTTNHQNFREGDFSLFRILQSSVEENLNQREEQLRENVMNTINQVHTYISDHVSTIYSSVTRLVKTSDSKYQAPREKENSLKVVDSSLAPSGNQDLLIVYDMGQRILLMRDVPPEYMLLALPSTPTHSAYHLRHGRAANIIYTGLVIMGGAPLAYRSLIYALDYPALAQFMVVSVVGSVSYSLWAWRAGARTRQCLLVQNAVISRIVARDDSAIWVLSRKHREEE